MIKPELSTLIDLVRQLTNSRDGERVIDFTLPDLYIGLQFSSVFRTLANKNLLAGFDFSAYTAPEKGTQEAIICSALSKDIVSWKGHELDKFGTVTGISVLVSCLLILIKDHQL